MKREPRKPFFFTNM